MLRNSRGVAGSLLAFCLFSIHLAAQNVAPPIPQKLTIHSDILNEDRVVWIRTPQNYEKTHGPFPVFTWRMVLPTSISWLAPWIFLYWATACRRWSSLALRTPTARET